MKLTIHLHSEKGVHREKFDSGRSSKTRVGPRPLTMSKGIILDGLRDRIDLRWKRYLEREIRRMQDQFKADMCHVYIDHPDLPVPQDGLDNRRICTFNVRNPRKFSNAVANHIIMALKADRLEFGKVSEATVVAMIGNKK